MSGPSGNGLTAKGFGLEVSAKGALVIIVILIVAMGGGIVWGMFQVTLRLENAQIKAAIVLASALKENNDLRAVADKETSILLRQILCASWYAPEERKLIRQKIEREPALIDAWCPR